MGIKKVTGNYRMGWSPPPKFSRKLKEDPFYFQDEGKIGVKMTSMETGPRGRCKFSTVPHTGANDRSFSTAIDKVHLAARPALTLASFEPVPLAWKHLSLPMFYFIFFLNFSSGNRVSLSFSSLLWTRSVAQEGTGLWSSCLSPVSGCVTRPVICSSPFKHITGILKYLLPLWNGRN